MTGVPAPQTPKASTDRIGDRKLKPSTMMMGHGYDPSLSEGCAEAADLPDFHLRLSQRRRGQTPFRGRDRQASRAVPTGSSIRASTGPTRRSSRIVSASGKKRRTRSPSPVGHVRDRHACSSSMVKPGDTIVHSGSALRRDRDADRAHPRQVRGQMARFPRRCDARGDRCGADAGIGERQRRADLSGKPRQSDQRAGRHPGGRRQRDAIFTGETSRRSRSTTPSWGRCGCSRSSTARTSSSIR